jgi:hypothetical protein
MDAAMVIWSCFMEQLDQISLDVSVEKMVQHLPGFTVGNCFPHKPR